MDGTLDVKAPDSGLRAADSWTGHALNRRASPVLNEVRSSSQLWIDGAGRLLHCRSSGPDG